MSDNANIAKKELDLSRKVNVRNVTDLDTYFRCIERPFDAKVAKKSKVLFPIGEVMSQIYAKNPDFVGIDGKGGHATFYIEDKEVRVEAGFDSEDGKNTQEIIDEKAIIKLFEIEKNESFLKALKSNVRTVGEKQTLREILLNGKVNEHDKISIAEKYLLGEDVEIPKNKQGRPPKTE